MDRRSLLAGIFIVLLAAVWMGGMKGERGKYEIIRMAEGEIQYPQVKFLEGKDGEKEKEVNDLILDHIYGPCGFLFDPGAEVGMDFEVTYMDEDYLSICYSGTYADVDKDGWAHTGDLAYGVTIDLDRGRIVKLEEVFGAEGREEILRRILAGEFETERGPIRPDNKYMDARSVMEDQPIAGLDGSDGQYFYFLREDAVGVIIIGLPRYGGSYSIIRVSRP